MKSSAIFALLLVSAFTVAQSNAKPQSQPSGESGAQTQSSGGKGAPQAKSKEEFQAYNEAVANTDPAKLEAAADAFAQKFPDSELKSLLYQQDMNLYQRAGAADKIIEVGRKAIAADPTNPIALVDVASALAEGTHESDLDRNARYDEATKDAKAAVSNIDTGLRVPPTTPPERVAAAKASILAMAYDTLGAIDLAKKNYPSAEENLLKAVDATKDQTEPVVYLRLSVAQDKQGKYPQALDSATKASQKAQAGSTEKILAEQQQSRLQKLMTGGPNSLPMAGGSTPAAGSTPTGSTPSTSSAPAQQTPATNPPASTPH